MRRIAVFCDRCPLSRLCRNNVSSPRAVQSCSSLLMPVDSTIARTRCLLWHSRRKIARHGTRPPQLIQSTLPHSALPSLQGPSASGIAEASTT